MLQAGQVDRDVAAIVLPAWGRVVPTTDVTAWAVVDDEAAQVQPITGYLREFVARGNRTSSVRSYAYVLLRWWRFLIAVDVAWNRATAAEARDLALWLREASKPVAGRRTTSAATAGTVNPITRKRYLGDEYAARTVRHNNAVVRAFYQFWIEQGAGPLLNPVPLDGSRHRGRPHAHHNPMQPFRSHGRLRYNPPLPKRRPRAMPDQAWDELFAAMTSDRDRAIVALAVSTGARAAELIGLRGCDLDWGEQLILVRRKGSGAEQWLAASPEAFVWLRLYLAWLGRLAPDQPLWWTLRRRRGSRPVGRVPLTYDALRAVLRRVNALLGTNWSMHDLRHTCAIRMIRDEDLSLRDVQTVLGHADLSSTAVYLHEDDTEVIGRVRRHLAQRQASPPAPGPPDPALGYDGGDLATLFGTDLP